MKGSCLWSPQPEHVSSDQRQRRDQRPHYNTLTLRRETNQCCPIFHKYDTTLPQQSNTAVKHVRACGVCKSHIIQMCDSHSQLKTHTQIHSDMPTFPQHYQNIRTMPEKFPDSTQQRHKVSTCPSWVVEQVTDKNNLIEGSRHFPMSLAIFLVCSLLQMVYSELKCCIFCYSCMQRQQ